MARCLRTGQQRLACRAFGHMLGQPEHDCGRDHWPGCDPNADQAARYGLWCYCPPRGTPVPCGPEHPEAIPDVNALIRNGVWDRDAAQWVLLDGAPMRLRAEPLSESNRYRLTGHGIRLDPCQQTRRGEACRYGS
jgi:hypothetical protein